jgi:hypothetical protein
MADYIGALVKQFESASKGSLALAHSGNDWGLSCGSYQLTLRWGNCITFLKKYFPSRASSLYFSGKDIKSASYPGSDYCSDPETVKEVWTECYNYAGAENFFECEHDYILETFYGELMKKLDGFFNPNDHSRMAQECLWSWAVHRGVGTAASEFKNACNTAGIDPNKTSAAILIDTLYDKRYASFSSSKRYKKGAGSSSEREVLRDYCEVAPLKYIEGKYCLSTGAAVGLSVTTTEEEPTESDQTPVVVEETPTVTTVDETKETTPYYYRVGDSWKDGKCVNQTGAYTVLENAIKSCKTNQSVFDEDGVAVYTCASGTHTIFTPYKVKVTTSSLAVRKGAGTNYAKVMDVSRGEVFTIVEEQKTATATWGKLKSGVGWISLGYTTKLSS